MNQLKALHLKLECGLKIYLKCVELAKILVISNNLKVFVVIKIEMQAMGRLMGTGKIGDST